MHAAYYDPKNPWQQWAPSSLLAVANCNGSPSTSWRAGSTPKSLHTSLKRLAVKSLTSLWRMDGNPPQGQVKAYFILKVLPQTHVWGRLTGCQPNLKHKASRNSPLLKANPCSTMGSVVNQHDAPGSDAASKAQRKCGDSQSQSKPAWADRSLRWETLRSSLHQYICWYTSKEQEV